MEIVLLAGNSVKNKIWIEAVEKTVQSLFDQTQILYYEHWKLEQKDALIDIKKETEKLVKLINKNQRVYIFAKSVGCLVALTAIRDQKIMPKGCCFVGLPVNWSRANNIPIVHLLEKYSVPTIFLQKTQDPAIGCKELKVLLKEQEVKNDSVIEVPGNNHEYDDMQQIYKAIEQMMQIND